MPDTLKKRIPLSCRTLWQRGFAPGAWTMAMPQVAWLLLAVNLLSLGFAFFMQEAVEVYPCALCIWERYPFAAAAALALIAALWKPYGRQTTLVLGLCAAAYLVSVGLGVFHSGVEFLWWEGIPTCESEPLVGASAAELRAALLAASAPPCDEVTWAIFGLSLANLNTLFSLALTVFSGVAARRSLKTP